MNAIAYIDIPSLMQWKRDSSVTMAVRANEPGILRIDELLGEYAGAEKKLRVRGPLLIDLFLTVEYWFKSRELSPRLVQEGRLPAMRGLFDCVVKLLAPHLADRDGRPASPMQVSKTIKDMTGAGMSGAGYSTDRSKGFVKFNAEQIYSRRLWFRAGRTYQAPWWAGSPQGELEPANSEHGYSPMLRRDGANEIAPAMVGWSPFIMTISRIVYMAKHDFDSSRNVNNYFHSSYNDGHRVSMAGTIAIKDGFISAVRLDSGHYHPGKHNLTAFLMALRMYGVDLNKISLLDFRGEWVGDVTTSAADFLASGQSWQAFMEGTVSEGKKRQETQTHRGMRAWAS